MTIDELKALRESLEERPVNIYGVELKALVDVALAAQGLSVWLQHRGRCDRGVQKCGWCVQDAALSTLLEETE